ncbi:MAG TPA: AMP-binding protein, partial [Polyangiales bacterium]|nr:AMP-binding protein [Polyangiales bacterium]
MIYVNDVHHDQPYFERCFASFDRHPALRAAERIAVCSPDTAFCLALTLYVKQRGGTIYPLPVDMPLEAARRRAERSGATFLAFGADAETALENVERIEAACAVVGQAALIQTSSGTTGEPKYIARSWRSIDMEIESYTRHFDASGLTPIVACPTNHSYGLICGVLVAIARGVQPVVVTNPNPRYILRKLQQSESPLLYASPPLLVALSMLMPEDGPIFAAMTSGTLLKQKQFEAIRSKVRHLHQQYGCSEAGCLTLGQDISSANELGHALPHVDLVAGPSASEPREIVARIGAVPVETRDLGYFEEGSLRYVSRIDDMINVSGLNVYPTEVEEVVLQMPGVSDAVVYRSNQGFGGDQVCLHVVADRTLEHGEIRGWCAKKLASHQVPMRIAQVESIPRMPNGKVSRKALTEASNRRDAHASGARVSS